jgi:hypothetical protein
MNDSNETINTGVPSGASAPGVISQISAAPIMNPIECRAVPSEADDQTKRNRPVEPSYAEG